LPYVDTGPILERDLAQRAGLGFIGKHTNLIQRRGGNWFVLAEILTTLELEPDQPETNRCGHCVRCIAACPTQAITAPFQLDARRCISYLTIESRGPIPLELRPAIGNRIFGCDDCLEVCPWNRFAREGRLLGGSTSGELEPLELIDLLQLDDEQFRRRFRHTPLWRAKREGLRRNVCIALGNSGDPRARSALEQAAHDTSPVVAEAAAWALDRVR
jgi:epoxyqueuosine reductase